MQYHDYTPILYQGRKIPTSSPQHSASAKQVKAAVRESVVEQYMAKESCEAFKSIMGKDRRPRLMKVLEMELVELDRYYCTDL